MEQIMALSQKKLAQKRFKKKLARKGKKYNPEKELYIRLDDKYENLSDEIKKERETKCAQTCRNNQFDGREKCYDPEN